MNNSPEIIAARINSEVAKFHSIIAGLQATNAICAFEGRPPMHSAYDFEHERIGHDMIVTDILRGFESS